MPFDLYSLGGNSVWSDFDTLHPKLEVGDFESRGVTIFEVVAGDSKSVVIECAKESLNVGVRP